MKSYKQFLNEIKTSTIVLSFGRLQPATAGHELLLNKMRQVAKQHGCGYELWVSKTQDAKKNPLPVDRKVYWAKQVLDDKHIFPAAGDIITPIKLLASKSGKFGNVIFVAGSDRVDEYTKLFNQYNGKDYNFESITVVSAGERDPDADDAAGMSATKMRQAAIANDAETFAKGAPNLSPAEVQELIGEIRHGLKVKNTNESLQGVSALRNSFYLNEIFRVGQWVSEGANLFEILDRGANYVVVCSESGELSKRFIEGVQMVEDANIPQHVAGAEFSFKGFKPGPAFLSNEQAVDAFRSTVERYETGHITDAVAVLKALKAVDAFLTLTHRIIVHQEHPDDAKINTEMLQQFDAAKSSLSRIGEFMHHMDYMDTLKDMVGVAEMTPVDVSEGQDPKAIDRLKVATIIADTLGADSSGSSPENIINNALRYARKNSLLVRGESLKIISRMLELATQVGIRYDDKILQQYTPKTESVILEGAPVKVTHDYGRVSYGRVKGQHGSVVEVSYRNGKVGFHHNHKIEQMGDVVHHDLGARQSADPTPTEPHTAPGHGLRSSSLHHQHMLVKKLTD